MSEGPTLIGGLITGGLGAALGTIATAVVQILGHKSESRASAADLVTHAAGGLAEQQDKVIDRLTQENQRMRESVWLLSDVIDELIANVELTDAERSKLTAAVRTAKATV